MNIKDIPLTWMIVIFMLGLIVMRFFGIDSWTTATLGSIMGYLLGKHIGDLGNVPPVVIPAPTGA